MLKRYLLALMLFFTSALYAQQISEEQAHQTALQFLEGGQSALRAPARGKQTLDMVYKAQTKSETDLYVFNRDGGGFVIVSADARTVKPVLGYSDQGTFDSDNIPPALQKILSDYQDQIEYVRDNLDPVDTIENLHPAVGTVIVEPLIKTTWHQDVPYNELCPMYRGSKTTTGCVATAMGQIMNYWQWPERGHGSHRNIDSDSLYVDFSQSVYDWDNMALSLSADTPQIKQYAVQKLLYDCGMATDMMYFINGTFFDFVPRALMAYFDYSYQIRVVERSDYTNEWDDMIKQELDASRPVLMGGGGHAYVCDGYDSMDYFHYNLGWGGSNDGFFLSDAIERDDSYGNYSSGQDAIIGIYPDYKDECKDGMAICRLNKDNEAELIDLIWSKDTVDIVIPDSALIDGRMYPIRSIPNYAFNYSRFSVYGSLTLPETLESIGTWAFYKANNLQALHVSASVKNIGVASFCSCHAINTVTVDESNPYYYSPQGSNVIMERSNGRLVQAFNNSVIPQQDIFIIGENAFYKKDSIVSIRLPQDITAIEDDAFYYCENLKEIYLGPKLKTIGERAFWGCFNLTDVYCYPDTAPVIYSSTFSIWRTMKVHVKPSAQDSYKADKNWNYYTIVPDIPETTAVPQANTPTLQPRYYDLMGRPVQQDYKGLKIRAGSKEVQIILNTM